MLTHARDHACPGVRGRRRALRPAAVVAVVAAVAVAATGLATPAAALPEDRVWLRFASLETVENSGQATTTQEVVSTNGGQLALTEAPGRGNAVRFPAYDGEASGPRAVLVVANAGPDDLLSPGAGAFAFGARVSPDASLGATSFDNGNNIVQRGLFDDQAQYKIQLDGPRASCRIKGDAGAVTVASPHELLPDAWYVVTCARGYDVQEDGTVLEKVRIAVVPLGGDGLRGDGVARSEVGSVGTLSFAPETVLSVGGKVDSARQLLESTDQFNGRLDGVFLRLR